MSRLPVASDGRAVLSACVGSYFAVRFAQLLISPLLPAIIAAFGVSRGDVGLALTGMWVAYALSQLPSGVLGDRYGERAVVLAALAVTAVGSLAIVVAPTFALFAAAALLLGVGAGLYYNAATALLTREFEAIGRTIGLHRVGSQAAGVLAPIVATAVWTRAGWRAAMATGVLTALVVLASFARYVPRSTPERGESSVRELIDPSTLVALLRRPGVGRVTALATVGEFTLLATMTFLPTLLVEQHGLSTARAGLLFSAYFAVVALCQPVGGWCSDRIGRDGTLAGMAIAGLVGYGLLSTGVGGVPAVLAVGLVGVAMAWGPPLQSAMMDRLPPDERGTGFGLLRTLYLLVGASGTAVVGTTADLAGWGVAVGLLAALSVVLLVGSAGPLALRAAGR